ncbi:bifunctional 4-hydroxy-2-oxoglutarate aldolase/2-dehydro-3-deoxy-phosphogluconate aldolase, partial [Patulibacter sp. S7RM1-6]
MTTDHTAALARLADAAVVAVVRAPGAEEAVRLSAALLAGGITAIELTFTTPGAEDALARVRAEHGDELLLGAGTVRTPAQLAAALDAGADFLVTPHFDPELFAAMHGSGRLVLPGTFTPSEVARALDAGADVVKLFPASLGGPRHLRALRGPFPELRVVPTGGIDAPDIAAWLAAG